MKERQFDCGTCLNKWAGRTDSAEMTEANRKVKGCWGSTEFLHEIVVPGGRISFKTCVGNLVQDGMFHWIVLHRQFQKGVLPYPGSLSEQPAKVLELFELIDSFKIQQAEEEEKRKQKPKGRRRG